MTAKYRLTHSAQADIVSILAWSREQFGAEASKHYEVLIATAIREATTQTVDDLRRTARPDLGDDVFSWHSAGSRDRSLGGIIRRPRHFLIGRRDDDLLVVGRVLHDAMDLDRHLHSQHLWE